MILVRRYTCNLDQYVTYGKNLQANKCMGVASGMTTSCSRNHSTWKSQVANQLLSLPSGKLTWRPWQSSGLEDEFPLKIGDFQGLQVNLPKGMSTLSCDSICQLETNLVHPQALGQDIE